MAGNASAIRAGQAFVELGAKDGPLAAGLKAAEKKLKAWGGALSAVGSKMFALGTAGVASFASMAMHFDNSVLEANKLAQGLGLTLASAQTLAGVFGDGEGLEHAIQHMNAAIDEAVTSGGEAASVFLRLGLSAQQLATMDAEQKILAIADALSRLTNETERSHLAQKVLGRRAIELLPILKKGSAGIQELQARFAEHHAMFSADDVKTAREFWLVVSDLTGSIQKVFLAIGKAVLPTLQKWAQQLVPIVESIVAWIDKNQGLIVTALEVAAVVAGAGVAIWGLGQAISAVGTAARIAGPLLNLLLNPMVLVPGLAIGAVGALFYLAGAFDDVIATAKSAWSGLGDAMKAGNLMLAGQILIQGLKIGWLDFRNFVLDSWVVIHGQWSKLISYLMHIWDTSILNMEMRWAEFQDSIDGGNRRELVAWEMWKEKRQYKKREVYINDEAGIGARRDELANAKAELEKLNQQAAKEVKGMNQPKLAGENRPPPPSAILAKGESVGSFSAAAVGGLGYGTTILQQFGEMTNYLREIAENTGMIDNIGKVT